VVKALSRAEMDAILAASELGHWRGRRDHALLLTLEFISIYGILGLQ
jgi:integrase/recombinase XerD